MLCMPDISLQGMLYAAAAFCDAMCEAAFQTFHGQDYAGNNLPNTPVIGVDTINGCQASCYSSAQCAAFTFLPDGGCALLRPYTLYRKLCTWLHIPCHLSLVNCAFRQQHMGLSVPISLIA